MVLRPLLIISLLIFITQCEDKDDPTLKPANPFCAKDDAQVLKDELKKDFPDIYVVIKIWFQRTLAQRVEINNDYNSGAEDTLNDTFCYFTYDALCQLFSYSLLPPENVLGNTLNEVFTEQNTEPEGVLEEIFCAYDKDTKDKIDAYYKTISPKNITVGDALEKLNSGKKYLGVMRNYCWKGLRPCQDKGMKLEDADHEAQELRKIDPDKDHKDFMKRLTDQLLDKYCESDMKMVFEKYRGGNKDDGINNEVQKAIDNEETRRAYDYLVRFIEDSCAFYADELDKAFNAEGGADTEKISRIVVIRSEKDLKCILKSYQDRHGNFTDILKTKVTGANQYCTSILYLCGQT